MYIIYVLVTLIALLSSTLIYDGKITFVDFCVDFVISFPLGFIGMIIMQSCYTMQ